MIGAAVGVPAGVEELIVAVAVISPVTAFAIATRGAPGREAANTEAAPAGVPVGAGGGGGAGGRAAAPVRSTRTITPCSGLPVPASVTRPRSPVGRKVTSRVGELPLSTLIGAYPTA